MDSRGEHSMIDVINFIGTHEDAYIVFDLMKRLITEYTQMKIVNEAITVFNDNMDTEPGWTSVLLLDASHISSHCYSSLGLLAIDIFTCRTETSHNNTNDLMDILINKLYEMYPGIDVSFRKTVRRFNF